MKKFLIINGPNLNLLHLREKDLYGGDSLADIQAYTEQKISHLDCKCVWFQSNSEGEIVSKLQEVALNPGHYHALILNPAAYSHTSIAILDSLKLISIPIIEVHLTNTHTREKFRRTRITAQGAAGIIEGLKKDVYWLAVMSQF